MDKNKKLLYKNVRNHQVINLFFLNHWAKIKWATKVLRHFAVKFDFLRLGNIPPFPQNNVDVLFLRQHRSQHLKTLNWGAGGIWELTLDASKIGQVLHYRKVSLSKSVSTTLVTHCLESICVNCGDFIYICKLYQMLFDRRQSWKFWGKPVADRRPTNSWQSANSRLTDGRQSAHSRPTDGQQSADRFFGRALLHNYQNFNTKMKNWSTLYAKVEKCS